MANIKHTLKMLAMLSVRDLLTLKQMHLIADVRPEIVHSTIVIFKSDRETNAFAVALSGRCITVHLLRASKLDEYTLRVMAKNAAHTLYKAFPVEVDLDPVYTNEELGL